MDLRNLNIYIAMPLIFQVFHIYIIFMYYVFIEQQYIQKLGGDRSIKAYIYTVSLFSPRC